jgi:iron complex outermembrane receptor protein
MKNKIFYLVLVASIGFNGAPLFAQDSDADADDAEVEEVIVTGSRIARSEYEGINPVTLITSEDIEASGQLNVSEVLRSTVQNTLGSTYEGFQNGAVDANISLRGAGSSRTLILLDGKRMPGSPKQSGAVANINVIPTAAIDRIEILTDGASAIYGGDASAGVVNIILKKDWDGVTLRGGTTEPDQPGGKEDSFSLVAGGSGDKSSFVFSYEHQERNTIYWKDRWYTQSTGASSPDYTDTTGISQGARTWINWSTFQYLPMAACIGHPLMVENGKIFYDSQYDGDANCGYDYTQIGADDASRKSDAISTSFRYQINDTTEFSLRGTFSRVDGTSRFAPAVGTYFVPAGGVDIIAPTFNCADGTSISSTDGTYPSFSGCQVTSITDTDNVVPSPGLGLAYVRFTDNGNREMDSVTDLFDIVAGVSGEMGEWNYDFNVQFSNQLANEYGYNYINSYAYSQAAQQDGFDPSLQTWVDKYRHDTFERAENRFDSYFFGAGRDLSDKLSIYVGYEYFEFDYESRYDAGRQGLNVIGSAGNSSSGSRDVGAFFGEALYTVNADLEISASARQDDYSDFGKANTYKIGAKWNVPMVDNLFVRASAGTSFIAPDMQSLYGADSESYQFARDYVACDAASIAPADCPQRQYATYITSNAGLEAEESDNLNLGLVWRPLPNQSVSLDYYEITFENLISVISLQAMIDAERSGNLQAVLDSVPSTTTIALTRSASGQLSSSSALASFSPYINNGDLEFILEGVDLKYSSFYEVGPGTLTVDLDATMYLEYASSDGVSKVDSVGAAGVPEWRANLFLGYNWADYGVRAAYYYIPSTAETRVLGKLSGSLSDAGYLDVSFKWDTPWNSALTFGVRNVTDEGVVLDSRLEYDRGLYFMGHLGQVAYVNYTHNF